VRRALALLAVLATAGCAVIHRAGANFWELERGPSGQAPDPEVAREAVVQVYAARTVSAESARTPAPASKPRCSAWPALR